MNDFFALRAPFLAATDHDHTARPNAGKIPVSTAGSSIGRRSERGLELSFMPYGMRKEKKVRGGRWYKKIKGQRDFFGTGPDVSDRPSYCKALAEVGHGDDQADVAIDEFGIGGECVRENIDLAETPLVK